MTKAEYQLCEEMVKAVQNYEFKYHINSIIVIRMVYIQDGYGYFPLVKMAENEERIAPGLEELLEDFDYKYDGKPVITFEPYPGFEVDTFELADQPLRVWETIETLQDAFIELMDQYYFCVVLYDYDLYVKKVPKELTNEFIEMRETLFRRFFGPDAEMPSGDFLRRW